MHYYISDIFWTQCESLTLGFRLYTIRFHMYTLPARILRIVVQILFFLLAHCTKNSYILLRNDGAFVQMYQNVHVIVKGWNFHKGEHSNDSCKALRSRHSDTCFGRINIIVFTSDGSSDVPCTQILIYINYKYQRASRVYIFSLLSWI